MKKVLAIILAIVFTSCVMDCQIVLHGQIINNKTKQPIQAAELEFVNIRCSHHDPETQKPIKCIFETDSTGYFEMTSDMYGTCPDGKNIIKIQKDDFKPLEFTWPEKTNDVVIELKPLN
jgi:hypothetical protein